jgi:osmotically-inducible protein OsmY
MEDKEAMQKQVRAALEHQAHIDPFTHAIAIDYADGVLTLEGEVPHVGAKKLALEAAAAVPAVRGIVDRLRVTPGERVGDGAVRDAFCKELLGDLDFVNCSVLIRNKGGIEILRDATDEPSGSIEVSVEDGVVTLTGQVISLSHKRVAGVLAWWARGCRDVVNGLEVAPPEEDTDDEVTDALRLVLETDPMVDADQIGIRTRNRVVTLEGAVASDEERKRAEFDAWCVFAVNRVVNRLEIRP